ncbi:hypothetical protein C6Y14_08000 [Streptomyces dioscori]|uniref:Uncharacterized protein n=1 Tax=Streptomyces dioscori TaxID=2109333 RepID=A0A2P8QDH4_9ACTN|nr:hypothetical protein [Streptomyces dioscori]PSM44268.1 hypothetical protein C6Y14_08000 [Streptomyces dioscori]
MGEREGDSTRPDLGALLAAAVRGGETDPDARKRALAAFRDARDEGAHTAARTRRRDDWRPAGERRAWSLRATLVALAASVTLGGVAVAAIGSGAVGRDDGGERDRPRRPSSSSPADPGGPAGVGTPGASGLDRLSTAQDTESHCRAYDSGKKRGKGLDPTAWQLLVRAAGGEDEVDAYCAARSAEAKKKKNAKSAKATEKAEKAEAKESAKSSKASGSGVTKSPKAAKSAKSTKSEKNKKGGSG